MCSERSEGILQHLVSVVFTVEAWSGEDAKAAIKEFLSQRRTVHPLVPHGGIVEMDVSDAEPRTVGPAEVYDAHDIVPAGRGPAFRFTKSPVFG